jgi:hypothetical protein
MLARMFTRTCELKGCNVEFQTDNPRKTYCTVQHANVNRARRLRAKRRKGGGGGGNGGGGGPTLFDEITTRDPLAVFAHTTLPVIGPKVPPKRKQPEPVRVLKSRRAA